MSDKYANIEISNLDEIKEDLKHAQSLIKQLERIIHKVNNSKINFNLKKP